MVLKRGTPLAQTTAKKDHEIDDKDLKAVDEMRQQAQDNIAAYHKRVMKAYNKAVKGQEIQEGDLVLKVNDFIRRKVSPPSKFYTHWEGPFIVKEAHGSGYY